MRLGRFVDAAVIGYLLGTIPSADIAAKRASGGAIDLRKVGTGNPGGANAAKVLGKKYGYAVMAADMGKGAVAGFAGRAVAGRSGSHLASTAAVIGHCFPVWNGFKGGKGVATSAGQCLATFPAYFPIDCAVAAVTVSLPWWKKRAFSTMVLTSAAWVVAGLAWWLKGWRNAWGPKPTAALPLAAAVTSAVIIYKFATAAPPPVPEVDATSETEVPA